MASASADLSRYVQQTKMHMPFVNYQFNNLVVDESVGKQLKDRLIYYQEGEGVYRIDTVEASLHFTAPSPIDKDEAMNYLVQSQIIDYLFCGTQFTSIQAQQTISELIKECKVTLHVL